MGSWSPLRSGKHGRPAVNLKGFGLVKRLRYAGFALALSLFLLSAPAAAEAGLLSGLLGSKQGNTPGQGGYTPPAHGTNPHGQGSVAVVDLMPERENPLPAEPGSGGEEVVAAESRAERGEDGRHSADATLVGVLGIDLGSHAGEGESAHGPLEPLQAALLDPLCEGLNRLACVEVLRADAAAGESGAESNTAVANVELLGEDGLDAKVAESNASIKEEDGCTVAHGDATTAKLDLGSATLLDVGSSSATADECTDPPPDPDPPADPGPERDSTVVELLGLGLPLPAAGCGDGAPNSEFTLLSELLATSCHADDSSNGGSGQLEGEYAVREALSAFVLEFDGTALLKGTLGASEAQAP